MAADERHPGPVRIDLWLLQLRNLVLGEVLRFARLARR